MIDLTKTSHVVFFVFILGVLSVAAAYGFSLLVTNAAFWVETLSPLVAYGLLFTLWNRWGWRVRLFGFLQLSPPDLNGRWIGKGVSSYKQGEKRAEFPVVLEVRQTFSSLIVEAYFEASSSISRPPKAYICHDTPDWFVFFQYENVPNQGKEGTMQQHRGATQLKHIPVEGMLRGRYFNDIGNQGDLEVRYETDKLLHRFQ